MKHVLTKSPFHTRKILAGNYKEFLSHFHLPDEAIDDVQKNDTSIKSKTVKVNDQ